MNGFLIYNDLFEKTEAITITWKLNENKHWVLPSFVLFDSKKEKEYSSFPWKWELENSIKILNLLSLDTLNQYNDTVINNTGSIINKDDKSNIVDKLSKREDILDLTTELSEKEWKKYGEWSWVTMPKFKIEAPISFPAVEVLDLENVILKSLENGVAHRPETQKPDQKGNFFLIWHSSNYPWIKSKFNNIFAKIPKLENGDIAYIYYQWRKFEYEVYTKFVVPPTAIDVYSFIPGYNMTLMTCYPIWTDKNRMIVRFKLKK